MIAFQNIQIHLIVYDNLMLQQIGAHWLKFHEFMDGLNWNIKILITDIQNN